IELGRVVGVIGKRVFFSAGQARAGVPNHAFRNAALQVSELLIQRAPSRVVDDVIGIGAGAVEAGVSAAFAGDGAGGVVPEDGGAVVAGVPYRVVERAGEIEPAVIVHDLGVARGQVCVELELR